MRIGGIYWLEGLKNSVKFFGRNAPTLVAETEQNVRLMPDLQVPQHIA